MYSIMVRMRGNDLGSEVELCRVGSNPEAIAEAARNKIRKHKDPITGERTMVPVYEHVEIKEV